MTIEVELSDKLKDGVIEWTGGATDWYLLIATVKVALADGTVVTRRVSVNWEGKVVVSTDSIKDPVVASRQA